MILNTTAIEGVYTVAIEPRSDERGFFARTWDQSVEDEGLVARFDYSCISSNTKKGTLRGMHYQKDPHGETKLVRCTQGSIFDVVIDLRPDSKTFKQWIGAELSAENHTALYIPPGCAHGFLTLTDTAEALYMISGAFNTEAASGVRWDDSTFSVEWPFVPTMINDRDASYPDFS